jgi:hypothetical protein
MSRQEERDAYYQTLQAAVEGQVLPSTLACDGVSTGAEPHLRD